MKNKFLSKSRFSFAVDCPTKLFYTNKEDYPDISLEDTFLEALAKGGFQVGELARCYYAGGEMIEERDYKTSLSKTNELLKKKSVIIYEAAFQYKDLFVRTDILVKEENHISLIEVKSKSYNENEDSFFNKKGGISPSWEKYIYDVAFQKYVVSKAFPDFNVNAYLYLADKNSKSSVDGLNQKFFIKKTEESYKIIKKGDTTPDALGNKILILVNIDEVIDAVWNSSDNEDFLNFSFLDFIIFLSERYKADKRIITPLGKKCKSCEFILNEDETKNGKKSGFKECWEKVFKKYKDEKEDNLIYNIWNFRKPEVKFEEGVYFISQLDESTFEEKKKKTDEPGLSSKQRQKLQYEAVIGKQKKDYIDIDGLKNEMKTWKYPLHMIDFETSIIAIPFNKNRRPYELVAFQFSHHIIDKKGNIRHEGQYINVEPGKFPNFDFLRELKKQLEKDNGTIFRYAAHEKTVLSSIKRELDDISEDEFPGKDEYISWILEVTNGKRAMVDLCQLVKKYYYSPLMGGSNSLKAVLPAILNESNYIQNKYSKPIYGSKEIPSPNYEKMIWIEKDNNGVKDPYSLLPKLEYDLTDEETQLLFEGEEIAEGGAAMIAYNKMQFTEMSQTERDKLAYSLLKYCELDTFAMVLLWEYWNNKCL